MQFATINTLDKIKSIKSGVENKNILYKILFKIVYNYNAKKVLKSVKKFLLSGHIDTSHMMDIIHTVHVFCSSGILTNEEKHIVYMVHTDERDNFAAIRYYIQSPTVIKSSFYREIRVKLTDGEMEVITTSSSDGIYSEESDSYKTSEFVDKDNTFYTSVGRALLRGIKKYLYL